MPKKPAPKTEPTPELVYELEGAPQPLFVVFSDRLEMYLAPNGQSWAANVLGAGTFTDAKARELAGEGCTVRPLRGALVENLAGANPVVLQAIAALGAR